MNNGAIVGRRRSPTLARNSSSARSPARTPVRMSARSRSIQSLRRRGTGPRRGSQQMAILESVRMPSGQCLGQFGRPTIGIGLAATEESEYRGRCTRLHVDRAPLNVAALWDFGYRAKTARRASTVTALTGTPAADRHCGDERGDRVKVLAVGLDGVRRGLPACRDRRRRRGELSRLRPCFDAVSLLGAGGGCRMG